MKWHFESSNRAEFIIAGFEEYMIAKKILRCPGKRNGSVTDLCQAWSNHALFFGKRFGPIFWHGRDGVLLDHDSGVAGPKRDRALSIFRSANCCLPASGDDSAIWAYTFVLLDRTQPTVTPGRGCTGDPSLKTYQFLGPTLTLRTTRGL